MATVLVDPTVTTIGAISQMAPSPQTLDGLVIGLLNADHLLDGFYRMLDEHYPLAGTVYHKKEAPSKRFDPDVIGDVAHRCQVAITAVGD